MTSKKPSKAKKTQREGKTKAGLYKRDNKWYIACVVNGKRYRKCIGPDKSRADAVLAEIKKQRAIHRVTGEMSGLETLFKRKVRKTFAEVAACYIEERPHLKTSTKRGYNEILKNRLMPVFGDLYIDQITEEKIARFQAEVSKTVTATRTNNIMGPLRYILNVALRRKYISDNPALNVPPLREEDPKIDPLNTEELDHAIAALKPHQRPLFICLAWTGARPDELFALRWDDVSFERGEIQINKGRVRGREGTTKTKSSKRTIPMFSIVRQALLELKKNPTQHVEGYVFLTKHGQPYDKHVDREWRTALKRAGVRHRPSYQLRHTFASLCLQNGLQPTWVAKTLGHTTPQITFKHYARFIDDASNENEKRMEQFLSQKSTGVSTKLSTKNT
jgi:integrase